MTSVLNGTDISFEMEYFDVILHILYPYLFSFPHIYHSRVVETKVLYCLQTQSSSNCLSYNQNTLTALVLCRFVVATEVHSESANMKLEKRSCISPHWCSQITSPDSIIQIVQLWSFFDMYETATLLRLKMQVKFLTFLAIITSFPVLMWRSIKFEI